MRRPISSTWFTPHSMESDPLVGPRATSKTNILAFLRCAPESQAFYPDLQNMHTLYQTKHHAARSSEPERSISRIARIAYIIQLTPEVDPWISLLQLIPAITMGVDHRPNETSPVPSSTFTTACSPYAGRLFGAALLGSSHLPWPSLSLTSSAPPCSPFRG